MWDVKTGVCIRKIREKKSFIFGISFNSKFLLTSYVGGIKIWKLSALNDKLTPKKKCLHAKLVSITPTRMLNDTYSVIYSSLTENSITASSDN